MSVLHKIVTRARTRLSRRVVHVPTLMLSAVWTGFARSVVQNIVGDKPRWYTYLLVALIITSMVVVFLTGLEWLDEKFDIGLKHASEEPLAFAIA